MDSHTEYDRVAAAECGLRRRVSVAASLLVCDCEDRQVLEKETEALIAELVASSEG